MSKKAEEAIDSLKAEMDLKRERQIKALLEAEEEEKRMKEMEKRLDLLHKTPLAKKLKKYNFLCRRDKVISETKWKDAGAPTNTPLSVFMPYIGERQKLADELGVEFNGCVEVDIDDYLGL